MQVMLNVTAARMGSLEFNIRLLTDGASGGGRGATQDHEFHIKRLQKELESLREEFAELRDLVFKKITPTQEVGPSAHMTIAVEDAYRASSASPCFLSCMSFCSSVCRTMTATLTKRPTPLGPCTMRWPTRSRWEELLLPLPRG